MKSEIISDYTKLHFSKNIKSLYLGNVIRNFAISLIGVFGIIFFFEQLGESMIALVIFFLVQYLIYTLLLPYFAKGVRRPGIKTMMILALPLLAVSFVMLILWQQVGLAFMIFYGVAITLYRLLYWNSYHIDFALFTQGHSRGKQMAVLMNLAAIVLALAPLVAGLLIDRVGYIPVFIAGLILTLVAIIPLLDTDERYEEYTYSFTESFTKIFTTPDRPVFLAHMANGMQHITTSVVWPVFIFLSLQDYTSVGLITTLVLVATIIIRFFIGRLGDRYSKKKMLPITTIIFTTGWVLKMFVETGLGIFITDSYHSAGRAANNMAFTHSFYEQAADHGHYIDEFTVVRNIATNIGRIIMLGAIIPIIVFSSIKIVFLVTAVVSLAIMFAASPQTQRSHVLNKI